MAQTNQFAGGKALSVDNVKKKYDAGGSPFWALKGVSLDIKTGEFITIVGKSGSGKSTLLNLLGGIDRQTEGSIRVNGQDLSKLGEDALSRFRGRNIGFIFQFFQLMPTLTALENVMLPMAFLGVISGKDRKLKAEALLDRVGLLGHASKFPSALSGGEQQRVAIARALANDPQIILADEPTGNLDTQTSEDVFRILRMLAGDNKCVVMVTHNNELAARCDRIVRISDGMVVDDAFTGIRREAGR